MEQSVKPVIGYWFSSKMTDPNYPTPLTWESNDRPGRLEVTTYDQAYRTVTQYLVMAYQWHHVELVERCAYSQSGESVFSYGKLVAVVPGRETITIHPFTADDIAAQHWLMCRLEVLFTERSGGAFLAADLTDHEAVAGNPFNHVQDVDVLMTLLQQHTPEATEANLWARFQATGTLF